MRTIVSLAELKNIETRTNYISNAYLAARTTDKIVFNAGPELSPFGHAGHLILVNTDLYGLKISGDRFHYRLSDAITALGFVPSMGGCDIWVPNEENLYA